MSIAAVVREALARLLGSELAAEDEALALDGHFREAGFSVKP